MLSKSKHSEHVNVYQIRKSMVVARNVLAHNLLQFVYQALYNTFIYLATIIKAMEQDYLHMTTGPNSAALTFLARMTMLFGKIYIGNIHMIYFLKSLIHKHIGNTWRFLLVSPDSTCTIQRTSARKKTYIY